ncbi:T9SS type A sorting domain-containing protein [Rhodocaloribacter sp.]
MLTRFFGLFFFLILISPDPARAQTTGACERGEASADLDVANVRARLYNAGGFFWKGGNPNVYNVPKAPEGRPITPNAIFTITLWLGGLTPSGELRMAASDYGRWEYWPAPLDDAGNPPEDCTPYDRIFKVSDEDLRAFDRDGTLTDDLRDWPYELGAPVVDGDGIPDNYDLTGGDRPEVWGEQTLWWVMNDVGNAHQTTGTPPMGMEVQVRAFAANGVPGLFDFVPAVANATFYHFRLILKGREPLHDMWLGWWTDADLGNATDDYVGTDTTLRMGFYYNADNDDEGSNGYGEAPPAVGFLLPQGPLVNDDGRDNDHDGVIDEPDERLRFTHGLFYNSDSSPFGTPRSLTSDWYNYLRGIWKDDSPICFGGNGYNPFNCTQTTDFMYPGDPVTRSFWSEVNIDGTGIANPPSDRLFLMSSGPFSMNPGDTQDLVLAIVWARGNDHLDSVHELRKAARFVSEALPELMQFDAFPPELPEENPDATGFYLMRANYPEPFSERTTIRYELPRAEHVRLTVHDVLGREVAVLVDAEQAPDVYDVTFEAEGLPAGVYLYRLVTRTVVITRRMVKVRR